MAHLGHKYGIEPLTTVVEGCVQAGVKYITVFAFSTENWRRSEVEVAFLMQLFEKAIKEKLPELNAAGIKINVIGRVKDFPNRLQRMMTEAEEMTKNNKAATLNVALSYGGKTEIVDAVCAIVAKGIKPQDITEDTISAHIYEAGQPDLDLIVRTSGEKRLSGFMLWQSDYAELYFTDTLWPDFDEAELKKALDYYAERKRNFGK
jgi:undecaprenyl diphosphate synthase